ncbi:hypothetical protein [Roseomonas mucosa]|uniref:hypothetical protein n=1 Tax=Roseomonas mucosa TaxID=207340 RepID=UPI00224766E5|nr:hypothetical protein [Roseomonas mucosa]UZO94611.1 Hypothetical protein RMP42_05888 [Roseomonas mucosa]
MPPDTSGFPRRGPTHYTVGMRGGPFRRLVAALAVVALLLAGFAAASVAADAPCVMPMPMAADMPCDGGHQDNAPDGSKQAPAALACFAKCPAPALDRAVAPMVGFTFVQLPLWAPPPAVPAGVGVDPPLHPPRA